ncbi:Echinocandin B biosynthetic cluster transcription factor ecdB [Hyphodiscus hymeniophilus]|uniref:Echinocandin B biosynthetic cluster transcription factor ecdB n=1 Tax=Hyphodiscus hymeniophilus TaxID=353542 RepID=A0A9P6SJZ8_9HELO|nr:Echinocandin B biosynthetic cluster transcription factor ecdB [Hyphodiscus hymeniophilus]
MDRLAYPRKRAVQACKICRRRRTKCDNQQPACTSCTDLQIECVYEEKDKSTFDAASCAILQRLDGLEDLIRSGNSGDIAGHHQSTEQVSTPRNQESPALASPALERTDASTLCRINIESVLSWPVFADLNLNEHLDLRYLLQSSVSTIEIPPLSITPDFEVERDLLDRFFQDVHIYNPVLEVEKVEEYSRHARFNGLSLDAQSCLLLLALSLGSVYAVQKTPGSESSLNIHDSAALREADGFFFAAQKRMGVLLCSSGLVEAQCFFLAGVYLMARLRPIEAWKMFVQALACCQGFPMKRSSDNSQSVEELQLQESIYWTCFKSELELRLELNVANNNAWDLTYPEFFPTPPKGLKAKNEAVWYFYLAEIALRRLSNRILIYIYQHKSSQPSSVSLADAIPNFEQQAEEWLATLPPALNLSSAANVLDGPNNEHAALRFILDGHLIDCYEMMYWPFLVSLIHGTLFGDLQSPSFAQKGIITCIQRIHKNEGGFYKRHHGTWLMIRSCTRSALVLVAVFRAGLDSLLPPDWEEAVRKVIRMLRYWREEAKDVPDRLDLLERLMKYTRLQ